MWPFVFYEIVRGISETHDTFAFIVFFFLVVLFSRQYLMYLGKWWLLRAFINRQSHYAYHKEVIHIRSHSYTMQT